MRFHYIVRGVCRVGDHILLAQENGASNTFLPGGHIERGENAADALEREIREELNIAAVTGEFLGAVEHIYREPNPDHHELNLVFRFQSDALNDTSINPPSREAHLEFFWCTIEELGAQNLLPGPMVEIIASAGIWASTIPRRAHPT